jgi:hypothetical protein
MKISRSFCFVLLLNSIATIANGATTFTLNPYSSFGGIPFRGDGSIQPGDSMGFSPLTGYEVLVSAPTVTNAWFSGEPAQDQRTTGSTNGFNMRGVTWDPVTHNLIFCDTHEGSAGTVTGNGIISPYAAIYILDGTSGAIIAALNTNGITGGQYTHVVPGVSDDGVVYVCNQTTGSGTTGLKIYRWPTANTNDPNFSVAPTVAFTNTLLPGARWGETMDVRGSGTNTQIIMGSGSSGATLTNVLLFTTTDGTNFTPHYLGFPGISTGVFNDGIAFGPGNTFFAKQVGQPLLFCRFDPGQFTNNIPVYTNNSVISSFAAVSVNDPLLNIAAIAYDPVHKLLAGLEEIGGTATGGRGKVWLFDSFDPTNRPPAVLASRTYIPNFQKTTAPMGYIRFTTNGILYAHASNNGFLVSSVDSIPLNPPTFTTDLPATTRIAVGQTAHFEVRAVTDVTNYQWYSNNVAIAGATTYFYDIPNAASGMSGSVFKVVAFNAAGSTESVNSTLSVVSATDFFHPDFLWSVPANTLALGNLTNFITSNGGANSPNERCIAYNALSNQLLVVRGSSLANLKIFVVDADRGTNGAIYTLKTTGMTAAATLALAGIGVSDDGVVYAATVANDASFKVYMWPNTDSNTAPITIWGTNSGAGAFNPVSDLSGGAMFRFGDTLAVRGSGNDTEILLDCLNPTRYVGILRPTPDGTMTNWTQTGYLLQNIQGSYGSEAYGNSLVGRALQFGSSGTFWQKRYNTAAGAPLAEMSYGPGGGLAPLMVGNTSAGLFTNGVVTVNPTLGVAAGINFVGSVGTDSTTTQDTLNYYDLTDPSQAVLLSTQPLPQGNTGGFHKGNANAVGQVVFGFNPATGKNYIFVIDGNNGVAAFVLSGGVPPPPKIIAQPRNLRVLQGSSGALNVTIDQIATIAWYKGVSSPVDTGVRGVNYNIANAALADAGDYFVIASNVNGSVTSVVAHVNVGIATDNYSLLQNWAAPAGNPNFPYVTADGGANTPNERAFAYNALSNQLIIVRCPPASTAYNLYVVDANTGSNLYSLNTSGVIHEAGSEVSGSNPIDLVGAAAAEDGSLYICNESPNASGGAAIDATKMFHVYRWANTAPTTQPVMVFQGDPSAQPPGINERWGDVLTVRGGGTNTEIFVNSQSGTYGAVLKPLDASLNNFTNYWFIDASGGGSIGRSIQFGPTNTVLEKRKGSPLGFSSYDTNAQSSAVILQVDSSTTLGGVAVDLAHKLTAGVDFVGSTTAPQKPDAVALYDISDSTTPMLINRYNFPSNQVANANVICQTIIAGNRVFALDANNGFMAFTIQGPQLSVFTSGPNLVESWTTNLGPFTLQATPSLASPTVWTNVGTGSVSGNRYLITNPPAGGSLFYRLQK